MLNPTCQFKNSICVYALSSSVVYLSNDLMPNDSNYFITTFKQFIMSVNYFTWCKFLSAMCNLHAYFRWCRHFFGFFCCIYSYA